MSASLAGCTDSDPEGRQPRGLVREYAITRHVITEVRTTPSTLPEALPDSTSDPQHKRQATHKLHTQATHAKELTHKLHTQLTHKGRKTNRAPKLHTRNNGRHQPLLRGYSPWAQLAGTLTTPGVHAAHVQRSRKTHEEVGNTRREVTHATAHGRTDRTSLTRTQTTAQLLKRRRTTTTQRATPTKCGLSKRQLPTTAEPRKPAKLSRSLRSFLYHHSQRTQKR